MVGVALSAAAQEVTVQSGRGPHYTGDAIRVQVIATGFEESPAPEISVASPQVGRLEFAGVSPSVSSSIRIQNGQIKRTREVRFVYEYRYTVGVSGDVSLGPFEVTQAATVRRVSPIRLRISPMASSEDIGVELVLPQSPIYAGARVPVVLIARMTEQVEDNLQSYTLKAPFFASSPVFRFIDVEPTPGQRNFNVSTGSATLELPGTLSTRRRGDRSWIEIEIRRLMVPLQPGVHDIGTIQLVVDEVSQWRRDLFGRPQAGQIRKLKTRAPHTEIRVEPLPAKGKPASFAGAVGRGFELEVAADRTVVAAGEPIELELTLRGDGLMTAALPPLDAEGLLPPEDFRAPRGVLSGRVENGVKIFKTVVRVLHEGVQGIPPLEYAWFDPETEAYVVTRSRPIALSVGHAQRVSAADVRSRELPERIQKTDGAINESQDSFELGIAGADLAIERDPAKLTGRGYADTTRFFEWSGPLYAISIGLVLWALWDTRRRRLDPSVVRRRRRLAKARRRIEQAAGEAEEGHIAGLVASVLREMIAEWPASRSAELDAFLGECDARSYAPTGIRQELDDDFLVRARDFARAIEEGAAR